MKQIKFFYDLETTGVNYKQHSIIQLSAQIEVDGEVKEKINMLIKPHPKALIEEQALKVNNRTLEEIQNFPLDYETAYNKLLKILGKYVDRFDKTQKMYLVGFNNKSFDDFFLRKMFELNSDAFFNSWFWGDTIDVMSTAAEYLMDRRPYMTNFKLKTVALELGIPVDETKLHEAQYDVDLTRMIYLVCTQRKQEPARQFFYYYHEGSETVWKTFEHEANLSPEVDEITFEKYKEFLRQRGLKDGPGLILDELM